MLDRSFRASGLQAWPRACGHPGLGTTTAAPSSDPLDGGPRELFDVQRPDRYAARRRRRFYGYLDTRDAARRPVSRELDNGADMAGRYERVTPAEIAPVPACGPGKLEVDGHRRDALPGCGPGRRSHIAQLVPARESWRWSRCPRTSGRPRRPSPGRRTAASITAFRVRPAATRRRHRGQAGTWNGRRPLVRGIVIARGVLQHQMVALDQALKRLRRLP